MTTTFPGGSVEVDIPGPTFDTVAAGSNATGFLVGGAISRSSAHNCVFVDQSGSTNPAVQLPSDSEAGDVFEIFIDSGSGKSLTIYAPSGQAFGGAVDPVNGNIVALPNAPGAVGMFVRKLTTTFWGVIT
jgi:hypothetical protein